jgi:hypothetical protein
MKEITQIEAMIFTIRGQKVMLDSDLAELYGVETKALIQAVKRNQDRFPEDFAFECSSSDLNDLRSQIVTSNRATPWKHKRWSTPLVFTESGVAMLSSVLNSSQAIQVNIAIIRVFVKLRSFLVMEQTSPDRIEKLEKNTTKLFKIVFERMDSIEEIVFPELPSKRKKIGIKKD